MGALENIWTQLQQERAQTDVIMRGQACPVPATTPMKPWRTEGAYPVPAVKMDFVAFMADFEDRRDAINNVQIKTANTEQEKGEFIRRMLYPSYFYNLGKGALMVLAQNKPSDGAPVADKLAWMLEASWWINSMLLSANIYPKLMPEVVAKSLYRFYFPGNAINPLAHLETQAFARTRAAGGVPRAIPYPIPLVGDYGTAPVLPTIMPASRNEVEWNRGRLWMHQYPWWKPAANPVMLQATGSERDRRLTEMHLGFASVQGIKPTFAQQVAQASGPAWVWGSEFTFDTYLPEWIDAMVSIPYWVLVRNSVEIWRVHYQQSSVVVVDEDTGLEVNGSFYVPLTEGAAASYQGQWQRASDQGWTVLYLTNLVNTMIGIIQAYSGKVTMTQWRAVRGWYDLAAYKYAGARPWEVSLPIPSAFARVMLELPGRLRLADHDCAGFCQQVLQVSSAAPYAWDMMELEVKLDNALLDMEELGGIWLNQGSSPEIEARERAEDTYLWLQAMGAAYGEAEVVSIPQPPSEKKSTAWLWAVAAAAAGGAGLLALGKKTKK